MPNAAAGNTITDSAQVNAGVIQNSDLASNAVKDNVVDAAAAISMSKLNLAITNSEVAAGAAIADSKLAQITTASKVSGAALTSLASIPAGAGTIPEANLPVVGVSAKSGVFSKDASTTTTDTIAHGLGKTPKLVRISMIGVSGTNAQPRLSFGACDGTNNNEVWVTNRDGGTVGNNGTWFPTTNGTYAVTFGTTNGNDNNAVISFDATNIIFTWTKNGTPTGTMHIHWEAIG